MVYGLTSRSSNDNGSGGVTLAGSKVGGGVSSTGFCWRLANVTPMSFIVYKWLMRFCRVCFCSSLNW